MVLRKTVCDKLATRCARRRSQPDMQDVTSENIYQNLVASDPFYSSSWNVTLTLNTDGITVFKSSTESLWPVYLTVNELPPHLGHLLAFLTFSTLPFKN